MLFRQHTAKGILLRNSSKFSAKLHLKLPHTSHFTLSSVINILPQLQPQAKVTAPPATCCRFRKILDTFQRYCQPHELHEVAAAAVATAADQQLQTESWLGLPKANPKPTQALLTRPQPTPTLA